MSRITGLITPDTTLAAVNHGKMLKAAAGSDEWQSASKSAGPACFGWTGWTTPNIFHQRNILIAVDGHFYNGDELGTPGTEAEIFAALYRQYGFEEAVKRLNGDFAIALYDAGAGSLWLARDRVGVKPLYYVSTPGYFAFASRPRPLLALPGSLPEPNPEFVALFAGSHYRYFDNRRERSPYLKIGQVPAAHAMNIVQGKVRTTAYWCLENLPDFPDSGEELAERYRSLLEHAVSIRLNRSQQPAFTLSGGMDSSSVLSLAVRLSGQKQHAFSTVYLDETYDESKEIASMLDAAVREWHTIAIGNPDVFPLVKKMIAVHDEPVATATWLSHFLLCEKASQSGFGALFGGLGGDELNAGEYEYFFFHFADLRSSGREAALEREIGKWVEYHDHPIFRKSRPVAEEGMSRMVDFDTPGRCRPDERRMLRYAATLNPDYFNLAGFAPHMEHPFASYLKNRTYQDIFYETAPCCLRAEDRQTACFGMDNFLPFFDHRLIEFMFRVPGRLKIHEGITKVLLRQAMQNTLPEETRTRVKKTGWNAPAHRWFSGKGREQVMDLMHSAFFRQRGIYNLQEVERLLNEHERIVSTGAAEENHMMFFWQLVNLELWLQGLPGTVN